MAEASDAHDADLVPRLGVAPGSGQGGKGCAQRGGCPLCAGAAGGSLEGREGRDARAQERPRDLRGDAVGYIEGEVRAGSDARSKTAEARVKESLKVQAQVLGALGARTAGAARVALPAQPDAVSERKTRHCGVAWGGRRDTRCLKATPGNGSCAPSLPTPRTTPTTSCPGT